MSPVPGDLKASAFGAVGVRAVGLGHSVPDVELDPKKNERKKSNEATKPQTLRSWHSGPPSTLLDPGVPGALAHAARLAEGLGQSRFLVIPVSLSVPLGQCLNIWEFPKIRGTLIWGPYNKDPTIRVL